MRDGFKDWLEVQGLDDKGINDLMDRVDRVEQACGSLDTAILNGSIEHLKRGLASRMVIEGDVGSGVATLRAAINKYVAFVENS